MALSRSSLAFCSASSSIVVCSFSRRFSAVHSVLALPPVNTMTRARQANKYFKNKVSVPPSARLTTRTDREDRSMRTFTPWRLYTTLSYLTSSHTTWACISRWSKAAWPPEKRLIELDNTYTRMVCVRTVFRNRESSELSGKHRGGEGRGRGLAGTRKETTPTPTACRADRTCEAPPGPSPWRGVPSLSPPPPPTLDLARRAPSPLTSPLLEPAIIDISFVGVVS